MMLAKTYFEEIELINCYKNFIMLLTSQNRLVIFDVLTQEKVMDDSLSINTFPNNAIQTKIDTIYFLSLRQIVIKADSFNPYKSINNKMILYYDIKNKSLVISSYPELTFEEKQIINNFRLERSFYNNYYEEKIEIKKIEELSLSKQYIISSKVEIFYDKLYKARYFEMNDQYMNVLKEFIKTIKQIGISIGEYILDDYVILNHNIVSAEEFDKIKNEIIVKDEEKVKQEKNNIMLDNCNNIQNAITNVLSPAINSNIIQDEEIVSKNNEMQIELDSSPIIQKKEIK